MCFRRLLAEHFGDYKIMSDFDLREALNEWRRMKHNLPSLPVFEEKCFWTSWNLFIINQSGHLRYYHMSKIVETLLHMILDTSMCERGFSRMNRIQIPERGNLSLETTNWIMTICHLGPTMKDFDPWPIVELWMQGPRGLESERGRYLRATLRKICEGRFGEL